MCREARPTWPLRARTGIAPALAATGAAAALALALAGCARAAPPSPPAPDPGATTEPAGLTSPAGGGRVSLTPVALSRPITLTVGDGVLRGRAADRAEDWDVWAVDRGGHVVGTTAGRIAAGPGDDWTVGLEDGTGSTIHPGAGEALLLQRPGDTTAAGREVAVLPALALGFDRAGGRILGRADPAVVGSVTVDVAPETGVMADAAPTSVDAATMANAPATGRSPAEVGGRAGRAQATVAPDGSFVLSPIPGTPLRGGRAMTLTVATKQGLHVVARRQVPWVRVSLHPGDILGGGAPLAPVTLTLRTADGAPRGIGRARAGAQGEFRTWFHDAAGERVAAEPGDEVRVEAGDAPWTMTVAPLTGAVDTARNTLYGQGQPGARLDLTVWNPWRIGEYAKPRTTVGSDGTWSLDPGVPIEPATHYYLNERLGEGDLVFHCQQLPRLHLTPGSPRVQVEALADLTGRLELARAGTVIARAAGGDPWSGALDLVLADPSGRPVALRAGDRLMGQVNGQAVDLIVPDFAAKLDPGSPAVTGRTEPGWAVTLGEPAPVPASAQVAGDDGSFRLPVAPEALQDGAVPPAGVLLAYAELPEKHNVEQRFVGPRLVVDLDTGAARVAAMPGDRVSWTAGTPGRVGAPHTVGITGTLSMPLPSGARPGSRLVLRVGSTDVPLTLPDLTLAYDRESGLASGHAPAGEVLDLQVALGRTSPADPLAVTVADDSRWALDLRGRPGRGHRYEAGAVRGLRLLWTAAPGVQYLRTWRAPGEPATCPAAP